MIVLNDNEVIHLLKEKRINITQPRIQVLKIIFNHCQPVFRLGSFLEAGNNMNRISVHRILKLLVEKRILNTVPNTKGVIEYSLWLNSQKQNEFTTLRKFQCKKCGNVTFEQYV